MARKSKLEGEQLEQFLVERDRGIKLKDLSVKYGLTISRLSQIYKHTMLKKAYLDVKSEQMKLPLEEVSNEDRLRTY